jgi:hypothetical protein
MRIVKFLVCVVLLTTPQLALAQACQVVRLSAGFSAGDVKGIAPADGIVCYDLQFPRGQNISIELASGKNVAITVPGHFDARTQRMFMGDLPGRLEVRVFQLMRAVTPQPFAVRIRFEAPGNG